MRPITIYSWICFFITLGAAYWTWNGLPNLEQFPVHWNAAGVPDRFGSKTEVAFAKLIMPASILFTFLIFLFIPKLEPIKRSIEPNTRPYTMLWAMIITLFVGIQYFITQSYSGLTENNSNLAVSIKPIIVVLSVFYLFIGNLLTKVRQNFFVGVRTPWTLTSDLAWEKTHRLAGRLMFISGVIGLLSAFTLDPELALYILIGLIMFVFITAMIYSFIVWRADPEKRT